MNPEQEPTPPYSEILHNKFAESEDTIASLANEVMEKVYQKMNDKEVDGTEEETAILEVIHDFLQNGGTIKNSGFLAKQIRAELHRREQEYIVEEIKKSENDPINEQIFSDASHLLKAENRNVEYALRTAVSKAGIPVDLREAKVQSLLERYNTYFNINKKQD